MPSGNKQAEDDKEERVTDNMLDELKEDKTDNLIPFGSQPFGGDDNAFLPPIEGGKDALQRIQSQDQSGKNIFGRPMDEIDFSNGYEKDTQGDLEHMAAIEDDLNRFSGMLD